MSPAASQIIRLHKHGGPEVLRVEQEALSRPGKGEVLVRHEAIGLNFIDTYFRTGLYPVALPTSLGNEAAGIVEAVGPNVDEVRVGDRVGYFTGPLGSYAARRNVSADLTSQIGDSAIEEVRRLYEVAASLPGRRQVLPL